jgi:putative ABC transport system permease protein
MNTLGLAQRNLTRNRRRSLATLFAMMVGGASILLFGGYVQNITYGLQTGYVRGGGHLELQHRDYLTYGSGDPTAYGIARYERVIELIKRDAVLAPLVTVVTPTLEFGGIAGNFAAGVSRTVMASGTVVADQNAMQSWNDYGFPGAPEVLSLTGTSADSAVIGTGVARVLRLCAPLHVADCPQPRATPQPAGAPLPPDVALLAVRDARAPAADSTNGGDLDGSAARIELLASTTGGAPNVARLRVAKATELGFKEADDVYIGMHLPQAQRLLYGNAPPQVTAIAVQLRHTSQIPRATLRLQQLLATTLSGDELALYDFRSLNPSYGQTVGMFNAIFGFIAVLIGAVVLFTVGNTMNTAVVERTVEIGTLRAIGQRRSAIRRLFVCEGSLLGAFGALLGVLAAVTVAAVVNRCGLTWTPPGRVDPVHLNLRVWGEMRMLSCTALGLTAVAVCSAWWPARRAAKLQVVEALRHV